MNVPGGPRDSSAQHADAARHHRCEEEDRHDAEEFEVQQHAKRAHGLRAHLERFVDRCKVACTLAVDRRLQQHERDSDTGDEREGGDVMKEGERLVNRHSRPTRASPRRLQPELLVERDEIERVPRFRDAAALDAGHAHAADADRAIRRCGS